MSGVLLYFLGLLNGICLIINAATDKPAWLLAMNLVAMSVCLASYAKEGRAA